MTDGQLTANHRDQITEVGAMTYVSEQRAILLKDRLPIIAVKLWIVEVFALNSPCLPINLFPLGARIYFHFELRHVERPIPNLSRNRSISWHDSPTSSAALIEKFFLVI